MIMKKLIKMLKTIRQGKSQKELSKRYTWQSGDFIVEKEKE